MYHLTTVHPLQIFAAERSDVATPGMGIFFSGFFKNTNVTHGRMARMDFERVWEHA
jgi:hypothetical protein